MEALKETVEKPLVLTSRSYAEENYVLTCDEANDVPEALFRIPSTYKEDAEKTGKVLTKDAVPVYFDPTTRLPIPKVSCKELQKQVKKPVLKLNNAPPIPDFILKEMENYVEKKTEGTGKTQVIVNTPAVGGEVLEIYTSSD